VRRYDPIVYRDGKRYFYRFTVNQRIQHVILFSSIILLGLTGFPLRHAEQPWARPLYDFFGGPDVVPLIHRAAGTVLFSLFFFHTGYWIYLFLRDDIGKLRRAGRLTPWRAIKAFFAMDMMPNRRDVKDFIQLWKYLLFLSDQRPQHERMSWREKFDYFAPYWGIPIVGVSGILLWWRDELSHFVPGIALNAAYIMHTDEALLAVLFLFFVHMYNVHFAAEKFPGATVWITGYLSEDEMVHEHYAEYVRVMTQQGLESQIRPPPGRPASRPLTQAAQR
jgi:cytochrome b subunit of formate dehydrogenase